MRVYHAFNISSKCLDVDPLSGVQIVMPIGPGTSDNPDEEARRMRKASMQLLAGIQPVS